ncbi:uncharacterized protein RAG0_00957 [Rhynchosporium agropyri]|uniref:Uncharacterized protein n=3 Tax=Rhynchosporium TaxID=38037 RepID=A0A1E1MR91_RHYSE|nr:uncharacterized protein RAG0_00957 [Rhynchosporium agropyri]CZT02632.1 uncharacterized protein RCO7_09398 [Rhynchosporium commune]CZT51285.1 uncharacterized protein RSE6_12409 [Rhynchosporium secalis]
MSSFYTYNNHQHPTAAHAQSASSHHSGRGRRAPRVSQNLHKQFRGVARKEEEDKAGREFRLQFEAARSFDLQDDVDFCPNLLTESDRSDFGSIHSSASDRSSLSSGSPESSPQTYQVAPDTSFTLNSSSAPYMPSSSYQSQPTSLKLHQPAATRIRNAIPIVNPSTGMSVASPPQSVSPSRMQHLNRRW